MTVANDHTVMNDADNASNWVTGGTQAPDPPTLNNNASTVPIYIDDGNGAAMNFPLKKDASGYTYTSTIPANFNASGGGIFVWWILYLADVYAIPIEYLATRFSSATGFTTNFREWKFVDSVGGDAQDPELLEGWTPCRVYPDVTTADGDNSNGTLNTADIESIGIVIEAGAVADGKFGGFDKCIYISEMQVHSSITDGLFEMFNDATNGSRPNRLGVVENAGTFYKFNVNIRIGDAAATALTTFTETGQTIFFDNVESSHELGFIFEAHATLDTNFELDAVGVFWNDQPATAEIFTDMSNLDIFRVDGGSFTNGGKITCRTHISDANTYIKGATFSACKEFAPSDMLVEDNTISGAVLGMVYATTTTGTRAKRTTFSNNTTALKIDVVGNYDLDGDTFSGNTYDIENAGNAATITAGSFIIGRAYKILTVGTTDFTLIGAANNTIGTKFVATGVGTGTGTATEVLLINALNGANPSGAKINNTGTNADTLIQNAVTVKVTVFDAFNGLPLQGARVLLYLTSDYTTEVLRGETDVNGEVTASYNYGGDVTVEGWAREMDLTGQDYEPNNIGGTIGTGGLSIQTRLERISV